MDEQMIQLLRDSLMERIELAFSQLRQSNLRVDSNVKEQVDLSTLLNHTESADMFKELFEQYQDVSYSIENAFRQFLYLQGAKDCVEVLRLLGVVQ